jgi:DNA-binding Lrp family transcriptional regulator
MDDIDRRLLGLLRANARAPVTQLARELKVARGTVKNRLARLEADGTVAGYTVRLRPQTEERRIRAFTTIVVEGNSSDSAARSLRGDPAVQTLYSTNGRWDMVAELWADSLGALDTALARIRSIDGITKTETSILLSAHKL